MVTVTNHGLLINTCNILVTYSCMGKKLAMICSSKVTAPALEFLVLWLLKKALPSREEPDISLSIVNSKAHIHQLYTSALRM